MAQHLCMCFFVSSFLNKLFAYGYVFSKFGHSQKQSIQNGTVFGYVLDHIASRNNLPGRMYMTSRGCGYHAHHDESLCAHWQCCKLSTRVHSQRWQDICAKYVLWSWWCIASSVDFFCERILDGQFPNLWIHDSMTLFYIAWWFPLADLPALWHFKLDRTISILQVKRRTVRERVEAASEKEHKEQSEVVVPSITKTSHFQRKLAKRLNFHDSESRVQITEVFVLVFWFILVKFA